jgi:hypothetical protein
MTDWQDSLNSFFADTDKKRRQEEEGSDLSRFVAGVVVPAFQELALELEKHGRNATIRNYVTSASLTVQYNGEEEIMYRVHGRMFPDKVLPYAEIRCRERKGLRFIRVESMFRSASARYKLSDITKDEIIRNFLTNYMHRVESV